jgi:hypothetical protein
LQKVITRGDGLHVPLELREVTLALEIVKDGHVNEDEEDAAAGNDRGHVLLFCQNLLGLCASIRYEESRIHACAILLNSCGVNPVVDFCGIELENEETLAVGVLFDLAEDGGA